MVFVSILLSYLNSQDRLTIPEGQSEAIETDNTMAEIKKTKGQLMTLFFLFLKLVQIYK